MLLIFSICIEAQVTQEWARYYDGPENNTDGSRFINLDNENNIIVTGTTGSLSKDVATIKYDQQGNQLWVGSLSRQTGSIDEVNGMVVDHLNNIFITGFTSLDTVPSDYFTAKYSPQGSQEWVNYYDGTGAGADVARDITKDQNNNVIVTGSSHRQSGSDPYYDIYTIKYDNSGGELWNHRYNGPDDKNDVGVAVITDSQDNFYILGSSSSVSTSWDVVIFKYNSANSLQWMQTYNGANNGIQQAVDVQIDNDGNVYVLASEAAPPTYNNDILLLKYNSTGSLLWEQRYNSPTSLSDIPKSLIIDSNSDICIMGQSNAAILILKYSTTGDIVWTQLNIATGGNPPSNLAADNENNLYFTSATNGNISTLKYDSQCKQSWIQTYPTGTGLGRDIVLDELNNIYVTGFITIPPSTTSDYATIKYSQGLSITEPQAGEKWIAGETDTIRWTGGQAGQFVSIEYSVDDGQTYNLIELATPADSNKYVWDIPKTILSTKVKIKLSDFQTSTVLAVCETFKIKPYVITRLDQNGDYIAYDINTDRWGFGNFPGDMWPQNWFQQFNYQGIDPFTGKQYPQDGFIAFKVAPDSIHPDWVSWVNTFGTDACYFNVQAPVYSLTAILKWQSKNNKWNGSCFGIAGSNALAFSHRDQFLTKYPSFPDSINPISVNSNDAVKKVVNELFTHQFGNPTQIKRQSYNPKPTQTINDIKKMLREDNVSIMTLSFWNNGPGGGGHTVLAYRLDQDSVLLNRYYIQLYDNANPTSTNPITIDTAANNGNGSWGTPDWFNWGGNKWIQLEDSAGVYLQRATLGKGLQSPFIMGETELEIGVNYGLATKISNDNGQVTGFIDNNVYEEIEGSRALVVTNGNITPPYGFYLPANNYSVLLNEFAEDTVETFFFTGNKSFLYERSGADQTQTDRLFFDGGVSVANPDAQTKSVNLLNLINETTQEKLFAFTGLELEQNDSVKIINPDENTLDLISYGSAKNYKVELNHASQLGLGRFQNNSIQLSQNTTHKLVPNWTDLTNSQLIVYVDEGNDGTIDDSIFVQNQATSIDDQGSLLTPNSYNLAQNFPNPFNPTTTIQYSIPQRSNVTLKVYDVLGNEIAALVNEAKDRGVYSVNFDASQLASGIYLYRIQAGSFVETKKMILMK